MTTDPYANLRLAAWRDALKVLAVQLIAMLIAAVLAAIVGNANFGLGVLIGAGIGILSNAYLAVALLGKPLLTGKPGNVLFSWLIRVGLTVSLLFIVMRAGYVPPASLIAGLAMVFLAHWLAVSFWLRGRR
jgi:hypothetical protein